MRAAIKIGLATGLFAIVHSLLASLEAKDAAARLVGQSRRDAFYRIFFLGQSLVTFGLLVGYALRLPCRVLYRVRGLAGGLMRLGQLAGVAYAIYSAYHAGIFRMTGLDNLLARLNGRPLTEGPVAQGPERQPNGRLHIGGPFRLSRHPLNLSPLPVFWLTPVMTTRRLAYNLVSTVYLVLGSIHEERRLLRLYGSEYADYQHSGVPFFWPRFRGAIGLRRDER